MSNFALVENGIVKEVIPSENPALPGFTIEQRYSAGFVAKLIEIPTDLAVGPNWKYDEAEGFTNPMKEVEA